MIKKNCKSFIQTTIYITIQRQYLGAKTRLLQIMENQSGQCGQNGVFMSPLQVPALEVTSDNKKTMATLGIYRCKVTCQTATQLF